MKKLIVLIIALALLFSCSPRVKKLSPDIKAWYHLHSILMTTKVPDWIFEGNKSERWCFLRIPKNLQRMYVTIFWKIRAEGLAEEFYDRYHTANRLFHTEGILGWKTDRGYALLNYGFPYSTRKVSVSDLYFRYTLNPNNAHAFVTPDHDIDGTVYIIWEYYHGRMVIGVVFQYSRGTYNFSYNSTISISNQLNLLRYNRKVFAPTIDGWDLVGSLVYDWTKKEKK